MPKTVDLNNSDKGLGMSDPLVARWKNEGRDVSSL